MQAEPRGRTANPRLTAAGNFAHRARWMIPASLIAAAVVYFAVPDPAMSQVNNRLPSIPFSSGSHADEVTPVMPKAPKQVELPPPPPMKYVPGMEEALVATGPVSDEESKDLDTALAAFHDAPAKAGPGGDYDDYAKPLLAFIDGHPQSTWNAALYLNLGLGYYHAGYYSRTIDYLGKSWQLGRNDESVQAQRMADRAVAELARMHARLGHADELRALFKDIGDRPLTGSSVELIKGARNGLWTFEHNPGVGYLCGPKALERVLTVLKATPKQLKVADDARSGEHGFSLTQLAALADKAKLSYTLIHREPGQPVPIPSIVNWKTHHYAAITDRQGEQYVVMDPTFSIRSTGIFSQKAIDDESSGYFLVPTQVMKANTNAGWRVVSENSEEAKGIYGMGDTTGSASGSKPVDCSTCPSCCSQSFSQPSDGTPQNNDTDPGTGDTMVALTTAKAYTMAVSLSLTDTAVGYRPQKGLSARTTVYYNQRDQDQPSNLSFSNLSPLWTHSWQVMVVDDPAHLGSNVRRVGSGGGGFDYPSNYNQTTGAFYNEPQDYSQLTRTPPTGTATAYTRKLPDGTVENYTLNNGAATFPRYWFLTSVTDPQGNTTTLNYDGTFRLTTIVDAMGRSTTFSYGLTGFPLLITQITDPFSRSTQITYDTSERLSTITDPVGITSTMGYSTTEPNFVNSLTTPYGTSSFSDALPPSDPTESNTRALLMTDPLGYSQFVYFYQNPSLVPDTDPNPPADMDISDNGSLEYRNTFYWDAHAVAAGGVTLSSGQVSSYDVTKSRIFHWAHYWDTNVGLQPITSRVLGSIKAPLENRLWFNYYWNSPGNGSGETSVFEGIIDRPDVTGRKLDDGTTQIFGVNIGESLIYNPFGLPYNFDDPLGREQHFTYDTTNNIDLLTVAQLTAPSTYTTIATLGSYVNHRPQTYTGADGQTWHYAWTSAGQINTITDPNSNVTTYNYDTSNRLSNIVNANNVTVLKLAYDSADRILTRTDYSAYPTGSGYVLTYAYDNLDRVTKITYPDNTTDLYDYSFQSGPLAGTPSLELRKHTDRLGRVTTYNYDADRRLTSVVEPLTSTTTRTTQYQYYEDGTLEDIIDANSNDTHYAIDIESRPVSKTYQYGTSSATTETYAYENTTSRLHSITDALGQVKTFAYAEDNRITGITYTSSVNTTPNVTFTWDPYFPRLSSMTDGTGTTNYSYTPIGTNGALKLSSTAGPYSNDTVGLTYDALGRLSGRNITSGNETFGYDAISRTNSHVTPLGSFTYGYLGQSSLTASRSVTNGSTTVSTSWGYDTDAHDWRLLTIGNSGVTRSYTLSYAISGGGQNPYDILKITDTAAAGNPLSSRTHTYTYDLSDRLLTGTNGTSPYVYDKLDNATTFATTHPTYNGFNQIKTWGSLTYAYDANGNLTSGDGVKTYKWDAENRVIEIDYVGTSNKSVFTYDGMGHRISDAETVSGSTTTTYYEWCGSSICQTRNSSQTAIRRDLDEGEYNVSSGQKLIYMPDQLWSVRDVLDGTTGSLVQSYDFNPYGSQNRASGSTPTDYRFAGLFLHTQSALNFATYRAQDGGTGRFINRDPTRESGGIDLYAYVGADPINEFDPYGLDWVYSQSSGMISHYNVSFQFPPTISGSTANGPNPDYVSSGYSGCACGLNNPKDQRASNVGPIPQGGWTIGAPYTSPNTGPYTLPLTPKQGTDTFGRTLFRIHGDNGKHNQSA